MRKMIIHLKGNSRSGYTVSMDFEKEILSRPNQNASAENIELLLKQQKRVAKKLFDAEFPEAATI